MEPSRYGGRAAFLAIIALLLVVHLANEDWYIVNAWNGERAIALTDYPFDEAWHWSEYEEAEDALLWTGILVWLSVFSAVAFLGFIFIDEKGLSVVAGTASCVLLSMTLAYFAAAFEGALPPEARGSLQTGWTGTAFASALLVAATAIRFYVVISDLPPRCCGTAHATEETEDPEVNLTGEGDG